MSDLLTHFEILEPPVRIATILGETVELTKIHARATLKFIDFSKKHDIKKLENVTEDTLDMDVIEDMIEIVALICKKSNPKITKDWLLDNLAIDDLLKFVKYVFEGMTQLENDSIPGGEGGKN